VRDLAISHYRVPAIASLMSSVCRSGATRGEPVVKATLRARPGRAAAEHIGVGRQYSAHETKTDVAGGGGHDRRRELPAGGGACCLGTGTSSPAG
jgi:hypothetical protein